MTIRVLSAGAAKGLVGALQAEFTMQTGEAIDGVFSAVGVIRDRFAAGEPCDVLILTATQLAELAAAGQVTHVAPIGTVRTAVAVPAGHPAPDVSSGPALAAALRRASALFLPDPYKSTAGSHVRRVIEALGLEAAMASKLRPYPNGETAMRIMAEEAAPGSLGITQTTEILYTPGITLIGPLPPEHDLSTVYAAAVSATATVAARALVDRLTGPASAELRRRGGFE